MLPHKPRTPPRPSPLPHLEVYIGRAGGGEGGGRALLPDSDDAAGRTAAGAGPIRAAGPLLVVWPGPARLWSGVVHAGRRRAGWPAAGRRPCVRLYIYI